MQQYPTLRIGSSLQGGKFTYTIQSVLGQGSFGITYLAATRAVITGPLGNVETEVKVAIKEFFMKEFSSRREDGSIMEMTDGSLAQNYLKKFRKEAENLAKLNHPNIVNVLEVFEANNTCYYAMQYLAGGSLDAYVKSRGGLPEAEAVACIRQIGAAVQYMHDHRMLHLDLKPGNVMRSEDGQKMVLIDFGLSKQYGSDGNPESSTTIGLGTAGYAPLEQSKSDRDKEFAPTLDVYALGATFFKLLTGQTPPDSSDVLNDGLPIEVLCERGVSQTSIAAIESAMEPRKTKRPQSVAGFLNLLTISPADETTRLDGGPSTPIKHQSVPYPQMQESKSNPQRTPTTKTKSTSKWLWCVAASIAVVCLVFVLFGRNNLQNEQPSKVETTQPVSASVVSSITGTHNGHEWVDLGLSVKWATMNVGATCPEDYGDYFAWGETSPKSEYSWENLKYRTEGDDYDDVKFLKYVTYSEYGPVDKKERLELNDDAARVNWGGNWRMPTESEFLDLVGICYWNWTTMNGKNGCQVVSKVNGNSIFLPAAGFCSHESISRAGSLVSLWSCSLNPINPYTAFGLSYSNGTYSFASDYICSCRRFIGISVRAVCTE